MLLIHDESAAGETRGSSLPLKPSAARHAPPANEHGAKWLDKIALQTALDHGDFIAFYQPQYDLRSAKLCGVEALARWNHPVLGLIAPAHFLGSLRGHDLLTQLTMLMLWQAAAAVQRWQLAGRQFPVSINAEWPCVESGRLLVAMRSVCAQFGIRPCSLHVELSEQSPMQDRAAAVAAVRALRAAGFCVAIDDFGVDNSSLQLLRELECDVVKLDRSLVQGIGHAPRAAALLGGVIRMVEALGGQVVAEGVESTGDLACLIELGCHRVQGFLYGRPMDEADLLSQYFG